MKIVFIAGSHPRHQFIARALFQTGYLSLIIIEERENHLPRPNDDMDKDLSRLFRRHFQLRDDSESRHFGEKMWPDVPLINIKVQDRNGEIVQQKLREISPDLMLTYGCHKLTDETLSCVEGEKWNIHGGLSPWYKGTVTHFWPSYMLEPQMTGMTVHELTSKLDAGAMVHQCAADLIRGDGVHDLACRAVIKIAEELPRLISKFNSGDEFVKLEHRSQGKLWLGGDWRPEHLYLIYEVYGDQIVDRYLDGEFSHRAPLLHRQF
jgi:methionyl-tRNA formyltransferase